MSFFELIFQLFKGFASKNENMATTEEVERNLDTVLEPYIEYRKKAGLDDDDDNDQDNDSHDSSDGDSYGHGEDNDGYDEDNDNKEYHNFSIDDNNGDYDKQDEKDEL